MPARITVVLCYVRHDDASMGLPHLSPAGRAAARLRLGWRLAAARVRRRAGASAPVTVAAIARTSTGSPAAAATATLAGARCQGRAGPAPAAIPADDAEKTRPRRGAEALRDPPGRRRGRRATLESPTLGRFEAAGPQETCFYIDVARRPQHRRGLRGARRAAPTPASLPRLRIVEYGPKGPFWYEVIDVDCIGQRRPVRPPGRRRLGRAQQDPAQARPPRSLRLVGGHRLDLGHHAAARPTATAACSATSACASRSR